MVWRECPRLASEVALTENRDDLGKPGQTEIYRISADPAGELYLQRTTFNLCLPVL
jgi:hypothetical protein